MINLALLSQRLVNEVDQRLAGVRSLFVEKFDFFLRVNSQKNKNTNTVNLHFYESLSKPACVNPLLLI